jgi:uncharacterized protein (UPF0332 family)
MGFPQDLLEQAGTLANLDKSRPRQASLRRAVSTAYYALFHLLTTAAVSNWKQSRLRADLARAFEHRKMNQTCRDTKKKQFQKADKASVQHIKLVAANFVELQAHRHTADYDNSKRWGRTEVLTIIDLAADAFDSWAEVRKDPIAEEFLLRLLVPETR